MTECERIIKEGILPKEFFKPETISDFHVDENKKKLWAICIDLLLKFDTVCQKHNLKYFVAFGSLLGIARHKGFIPWDDDLDVCMLREDYEKLKRYSSEFEDPYFLQFPGYDQDYYYSYAKVRNSKTSDVSIPFRYAHFNQGIAIDIFPLDNCKLEDLNSNSTLISELIMENSANMRRSNLFPTENDLKRCEKYKESNPRTVLNKIEKIARQYESLDTEWITCATVTTYEPKRITYKKSDVTNLIKSDFYGHSFPVPNNIDKMLKITYGDYMQFPPIEQRGTWHSTEIFNPDVPYQDTISELIRKDKGLII